MRETENVWASTLDIKLNEKVLKDNNYNSIYIVMMSNEKHY